MVIDVLKLEIDMIICYVEADTYIWNKWNTIPYVFRFA